MSEANKVAAITPVFWIAKICATTLGETAGDLLSMTLNVGYALSSAILLSVFAVVLGLQLRARRFHAGLYWGVILATSTAGTTLSDFMDRSLHLGYATGSLILVSLLALVLGIWRLSEKSLAVDTIRSPRAEGFYWAAILVSNTLGTALGDFLADDSGLGFLGGAALIGTLLGLLLLARYATRLNRVLLFWCAFVLTRPFGATFGDLLTKSSAQGGLGFGTMGSSGILALLLVGVLLFDSHRRKAASAGHPPLVAESE